MLTIDRKKWGFDRFSLTITPDGDGHKLELTPIMVSGPADICDEMTDQMTDPTQRATATIYTDGRREITGFRDEQNQGLVQVLKEGLKLTHKAVKLLEKTETLDKFAKEVAARLIHDGKTLEEVEIRIACPICGPDKETLGILRDALNTLLDQKPADPTLKIHVEGVPCVFNNDFRAEHDARILVYFKDKVTSEMKALLPKAEQDLSRRFDELGRLKSQLGTADKPKRR